MRAATLLIAASALTADATTVRGARRSVAGNINCDSNNQANTYWPGNTFDSKMGWRYTPTTCTAYHDWISTVTVPQVPLAVGIRPGFFNTQAPAAFVVTNIDSQASLNFTAGFVVNPAVTVPQCTATQVNAGLQGSCIGNLPLFPVVANGTYVGGLFGNLFVVTVHDNDWVNQESSVVAFLQKCSNGAFYGGDVCTGGNVWLDVITTNSGGMPTYSWVIGKRANQCYSQSAGRCADPTVPFCCANGLAPTGQASDCNVEGLPYTKCYDCSNVCA